jgi:hypothetical protein
MIFPEGHPQNRVAIQQGMNLAENFKLIQKDKAIIPLNITKGSMAIIGKMNGRYSKTKNTFQRLLPG